MIIKNILVPTDFSAESLNSLRYAIHLAEKLDASIKVFHNIYPDQGFHEGLVVAAPAAQYQIADAQKKIKEFIEKALVPLESEEILGNTPEIAQETRLGIPAANIARIAAEENMDLIVMASKPSSSFWTKLAGSTPVEVVGRAICPVLFVPDGSSFQGVKRLAFASDLEEASPYRLWKVMMTLSPIQPQVSYVHVGAGGEDQDTTDNLMLFIRQNPLMKGVEFVELKGADVAQSMETYAEDEGFDMVAIQSARKKLWQRLFTKSNARDLVYLSRLPLLVLR
jgi:nucleotide-binding universal stress UspA family protein